MYFFKLGLRALIVVYTLVPRDVAGTKAEGTRSTKHTSEVREPPRLCGGSYYCCLEAELNHCALPSSSYSHPMILVA